MYRGIVYERGVLAATGETALLVKPLALFEIVFARCFPNENACTVCTGIGARFTTFSFTRTCSSWRQKAWNEATGSCVFAKYGPNWPKFYVIRVLADALFAWRFPCTKNNSQRIFIAYLYKLMIRVYGINLVISGASGDGWCHLWRVRFIGSGVLKWSKCGYSYGYRWDSD